MNTLKRTGLYRWIALWFVLSLLLGLVGPAVGATNGLHGRDNVGEARFVPDRQVELTQSPQNVELVGHIGGYLLAVAAEGNYAYIVHGSKFVILDMTTPTPPMQVGSVMLPSDDARDVAVVGAYAYVAAVGGGLQIIDISNPTMPIVAGAYHTWRSAPYGYAMSVAVAGDYAYVTAGMGSDGYLLIINVTNPSEPTLVGTYVLPSYSYDVAVVGEYAYVADYYSGLQIINIANPYSPTLVGEYTSPGRYARGVDVTDSYAYVAAGELQIIDISNPYSPTLASRYTSGYVHDVALANGYAHIAIDNWYTGRLEIIDIHDPYAPTRAGIYNTPNRAMGVAALGEYAYVAAGWAALQIINVSSPSTPTLAAIYDTFGPVRDVAVDGAYAYIAGGYESGLQIIDMSNPNTPIRAGTCDTPGSADTLVVAGGYAYVVDVGALQIIDITNPYSPTLVGTYDTIGFTRDVAVAGAYAYIVCEDSGLEIVDITNPYSPTLVANYDTPGQAYGVAVVNEYVYIADGNSLQIINVADPNTPILVGVYDMSWPAMDVAVVGRYAYIAQGNWGLQIIDISDPSMPTGVGSYDTSDTAYRVAVADGYAYIADQYGGLCIVDVRNPVTPILAGRYDETFATGVAVAGDYIYVAAPLGGFFALRFAGAAFPTIWHVATTGSDVTGDGSAEYPFATIQKALSVAQSGDEIRVAEGVYYPDEGPGQTNDDRYATFLLQAGVALMGGYSPTFDERNWETYVTILSGDLDQNDINADSNSVAETWNDIVGNNAYHVVTSSGVSETAVLDGFTITAGKAEGYQSDGAGMYNYYGSPTLMNIVFSGNRSYYYGGGMCNVYSSPRLSNAVFTGNAAENYGGGILNNFSSPTLEHVVFSGNTAFSWSGGGISNLNDSNPTLAHVIFSGNTAAIAGGGMNNESSSPTLEHVDFSGNTANTGGGMHNWSSEATLTNITFKDNTAISHGGGINNEHCSPTLTNVTFSGNSALSFHGGGMYNFSSDPLLTNVAFSGNTSSQKGGGLYNYSSSDPIIVNTILWGNTAALGGDQIGNDSSTPLISYSDIQASGGSGPGWDSSLGTDGGGNIDADPLFVDAASGNLRLQPGSPAIDAGDNSAVTVPTDLDGNPRIINGVVDMGAYEFAASLVDVVLFAADNPITSTANLTHKYGELLAALRLAAAANPSRTIVLLADLDGPSDTHVRVLQGTEGTLVTGLPDAAGAISPTLHEYNMADSDNLGGFLHWALATYAPGCMPVTVHYIGHGTYIAPETDITQVFTTTSGLRVLLGWIFPLPSRIDANPDLTDVHPPALFAPQALAAALESATAERTCPLDLLDLVHCHAGSIEELYSLAPYAARLLASPLYAYWSPAMTGAALGAVHDGMTPQEQAAAVLGAYHQALLDADDPLTAWDDHPHILVAVDPDGLAGLREAWDQAAALILAELELDPAGTRGKLLAAYQAAAKYDTTFCDGDFECAAPDALADFAAFAEAVALAFGEPVAPPAQAAAQQAADMVTARHATDGIPWFAAPRTPTWDLANLTGLSFFTPFTGTVRGEELSLPWPVRWYTETLSDENPNPLAWTVNTAWDTVVERYWAGYVAETGMTLTTEACLPEFSPPLQFDGNVRAVRITAPPLDTVSVYSPTLGNQVWPAGIVSTTVDVSGLPVRFEVWMGGAIVYSNTVAVGYLPAGAQREVRATQAWFPDRAGAYTLVLIVDPDNRIRGEDEDEEDNRREQNDNVLPSNPPHRPAVVTATLSDGRQFVASNTVLLDIDGNVSELLIQVYQYPEHLPPNTQVVLPTPIYTYTLEGVTLPMVLSLTIPMGSALHPGPVVLHVWGTLNNKHVRALAVVTFNYAPAGAALEEGEGHYYLVDLVQDDRAVFGLAAPVGDPNLFLWDPYNYGPPTWEATVSDTLALDPAPFTGQYLLLVHGETAASYTLTFTRNGEPGRQQAAWPAASNPAAYVPAARPHFLPPLPDYPVRYTAYLPLVVRVHGGRN